MRTTSQKKKPTFDLTADVKLQLKEIAEQCHPLPENVPVWRDVDGEYLLNKGITQVKKDGETQTVLAGKTYHVPMRHELKDANHASNLRKHYLAGGILAVHGYLVGLVEHEAQARQQFPHLFEDGGKGRYLGVASQN